MKTRTAWGGKERGTGQSLLYRAEGLEIMQKSVRMKHAGLHRDALGRHRVGRETQWLAAQSLGNCDPFCCAAKDSVSRLHKTGVAVSVRKRSQATRLIYVGPTYQLDDSFYSLSVPQLRLIATTALY